jgi:CubicO group peptidase (beta-lactamase class C family)
VRGATLLIPGRAGHVAAVALLAVAFTGYSADAAGSDRGPLPTASAEEAGFRPSGLDEVERIVEAAVEDGAFPGAVLAIGRRGSLVRFRAFGHHTYEPGAPEVRTDTIYDLASLTKVVATTTVAMILVDQGRLDLDAPVSGIVPRFRGGAKDGVRVRQLLTHSGGLLWWAPLYEELRGPRAYLERILEMDLDYEPGSKTVYSDLGVILLGDVLERLAKDRAHRTRSLAGAGLARRGPRREHLCPRRGGSPRGAVQHRRRPRPVCPDAPEHGRPRRTPGRVAGHGDQVHRPGPGRCRIDPGPGLGSLLSPRSFGHTGFTGTLMWMDPDRQLFVVLLTNRVHPTRDNRAILAVRPRVTDAVVRALEES